MGEAVIQCHGIVLTALEAEPVDEAHKLTIERVEDEYFVKVEHPMTKDHYISFMACVSSDRLQLVKFYPEWNAEARFKISCVKKLLFYCNRDGLFEMNVNRDTVEKPQS